MEHGSLNWFGWEAFVNIYVFGNDEGDKRVMVSHHGYGASVGIE